MKLKYIALGALSILPLAVCVPTVAEAIAVGQYQTHELVFTASTLPANPFDTYLLRLEITDPRGKKFTIDGFYDGNGNGDQIGNIWKARISPYRTGVWHWRTVPGDAPDRALEGLSGRFECVTSDDLGGVVSVGKHFRFQGGDYVYLVGNFLDFTVQMTHLYMSESSSDSTRNAIVVRNRDFHNSNKINIYLANVGDYDGIPVTPWLGTSSSNNKARMDLGRWWLYDQYIARLKDEKMLAQIWFFADESGFGGLSQADKNRLFRYAMARTSAFSHVMYVIALEWEEGWSHSSVTDSGNFIQANNPWDRPLSVHSVGASWAFSGENWATFIASQPGNNAKPDQVNRAAVTSRMNERIPYIGEEFGQLKTDSDARLRANLWANFTGGAAGSGTGSDLRAFQRFLAQSRVPFQRMVPVNDLVEGGGKTRFALAENGNHYVVYSRGGAFTLNVTGKGLSGRWFNPRDPNASLGAAFSVSPGRHMFTPSDDVTKDWVLWISNGNKLLKGLTHLGGRAALTHEIINGARKIPHQAQEGEGR